MSSGSSARVGIEALCSDDLDAMLKGGRQVDSDMIGGVGQLALPVLVCGIEPRRPSQDQNTRVREL